MNDTVIVGDEAAPAVLDIPDISLGVDAPGMPPKAEPTDFSAGPLKILQWPHEALRTPCEPVTPEEVLTQDFVDRVRMLGFTLAKHGGYGLAANQVGWMKRVLVMVHPVQLAELGARQDNAQGTWQLDLVALVNPVIVATRGGQMSREEACLSFYGAGAVEVPSFEDVDVECPDIGREDVMPMHCGKLRYIGLAARVVSHEVGHLFGRSLLDRLGKMQRILFMKQLRKAQKARSRAS